MPSDRTVVRDGVPSLHQAAVQLCRLVGVFAPIIRQKYSGNAPLMTALTAAEACCSLLPEALYDVLNVAGDNQDALDNPESLPGVNPDAPPYIPPEEE